MDSCGATLKLLFLIVIPLERDFYYSVRAFRNAHCSF